MSDTQHSPDVRAFAPHSFAERLRMQRAALVIDVQSVRFDSHFNHIRLQIFQDGWRKKRRRAVRAIHHDFDPTEIRLHIRKNGLNEMLRVFF